MRSIVKVTCLVITLVTLSSCGRGVDKDVVARSQLSEMTRAQLHRLVLDANTNATSFKSPEDARRQLIIEAMAREALLHESHRRKLDVDPVHREKMVSDWLEHLADEYVNQRLESATSISDEDVEAFYQENVDHYKQPAQVRLRHVFKRFGKSRTEDEARQQINHLRQLLLDGSRLDEIARIHSDSETAVRGGDMGWVPIQSMHPSLQDLVNSLEVNEISRVIKTSVGFHVFTLVAKSSEASHSLAQVRNKIRQGLQTQAQGVAIAKIMDDLAKRSGAVFSLSEVEDAWQAGKGPVLTIPDREDLSIDGAELRQLWGKAPFLEQRHLDLQHFTGNLVLKRLILWHLGTEEQSQAVPESFEQEWLLETCFRQLLDDWFKGPEGKAELEAFYRTHMDLFSGGREFRVEMIACTFDYAAKPFETLILMERFSEQARAGTPFSELAGKHSDDPSRVVDGNLGWRSLSELIEWLGPEARAEIEEFKVGYISRPLLWREDPLTRQARGYFQLHVAEERELDVKGYDQSYQRVREAYYHENSALVRSTLMEQVLESVEFELFEEHF